MLVMSGRAHSLSSDSSGSDYEAVDEEMRWKRYEASRSGTKPASTTDAEMEDPDAEQPDAGQQEQPDADGWRRNDPWKSSHKDRRGQSPWATPASTSQWIPWRRQGQASRPPFDPLGHALWGVWHLISSDGEKPEEDTYIVTNPTAVIHYNGRRNSRTTVPMTEVHAHNFILHWKMPV